MKCIPFSLKEGNSEIHFKLDDHAVEKLFAFAKSLSLKFRCKEEDLWMDMVQNVFVAILKSPEYPKGLKDALKSENTSKQVYSYLLTCIVNEFRQWHRKEEKLVTESLEDSKHLTKNEPFENGHILFHGIDVKNDLDELCQFVERFKAEFSPQILEYWRWASKTDCEKEISDKLGCNEDYVRKVKYKFKKKVIALQQKFQIS